MTLHCTALGSKGNLHSLSDIGGAANDVKHLVARVNLEKVKLFGAGVILNREDFCNDDTVGVLALYDDVLNLCGGEGEVMYKRLFVKSGEVNEVSDPIHR